MHAKIIQPMSEKLTKMIPKPVQNRSWRGSGGHLGATLETRCFQDLIFDDFGSNLEPVWAHFGHHVFHVFLKWLFDGLLASIWAPKTPPKWDPKGGQNQNLNFIDFALICNTWATFEGPENHHFLLLFWNPILGWLLEPIFIIVALFWGPFWFQFGAQNR